MANQVNNHGFAMDVIGQTETPFYYYDMDVLQQTLRAINQQVTGHPFMVHYAVKANGNPRILKEIAASGLGVDLVSGGEVQAALDAGFKPGEMTFSGVGKTDWEIRLGLDRGIGCFNVESVPELIVINELAAEMDTVAPIAIRVNPDIDAHTHKYITTGLADGKFGINIEGLDQVVDLAMSMPHVHLRGLHFHIGSQITLMQPYVMLCDTIGRLVDHYEQRGISFEMLNVGGGLGIDYTRPDECCVPDFQAYFETFKRHLKLRPGQTLHFELGRSVVAGCGSLISRVVYVKDSRDKQFVILDAGMNDLMRPALYEAYHEIQNLTSREEDNATYDVVGPICESSDVFARGRILPVTHRGDLIAIRSAGAYGESMASQYNMRRLPRSIFFSAR